MLNNINKNKKKYYVEKKVTENMVFSSLFDPLNPLSNRSRILFNIFI